MKYREALNKLENIVREIEEGKIDVDELAEKVREAASLSKLCTQKLRQANNEVQNVLSEVENIKNSLEVKVELENDSFTDQAIAESFDNDEPF